MAKQGYHEEHLWIKHCRQTLGKIMELGFKCTSVGQTGSYDQSKMNWSGNIGATFAHLFLKVQTHHSFFTIGN